MSVARPLPHDAAHLHVQGAARYVDDIPVPGDTLHIAFGQSPVARGRIVSVDLDPVRAAPGVVRVLSAADLPYANDTSPSNHDEPLLATGEVHFAGQPIFAVIAQSHLDARRAARLAIIEIAEEAPILSIEAALEQDSRFEEGPRVYASGDPEGAIVAAAHRLTGRLDVGGQEHFYLEGQAALAIPGEDGDMHVHSSTQHPTEIQHKVAEAIGLPMHAVRIETRRMGGGFGGKESQGNALAVICAIAARATGRPCKMRYDRDDDMILTGKRHDIRIDYEVGFDETGRIAGLELTHYLRCGWSMDLSLPVADRAMLHAANCYHLPNMRVTSHRLRTNMASATAFRGFGGPQGIIGIERVMDHIAAHLALDPVEVRRRNYFDAALSGQRTHYGMEVTDFVLHGLTDRLLHSADYAARRARVAAWNAAGGPIRKGIGFSPVQFGISFTLSHLNQAGALVHVYQDGSIALNHGGTEMGQGLFQKVAQVAASRFGIGMEAVRITATDTAKVPNTSATAASSGSDLNGMAVRAACDTIRARIAGVIAARDQVDAASVRFDGGRVITEISDLSFAEAAQIAYMARVSLSSTGYYRTPKLEWDRIKGQGRPFFYFAYGAAITEVALDIRTGENRILRADILHDAGSSLNPALDIGQIEGGYVQGAGWLTTEELVWDARGHLRTHAPSTYKIPACSDAPDIFNVALWDAPNTEETIYRSKAVGEPPFMLGISAWLALSDAAASTGKGYPALNAPATSEEMWRAMQRARA